MSFDASRWVPRATAFAPFALVGCDGSVATAPADDGGTTGDPG